MHWSPGMNAFFTMLRPSYRRELPALIGFWWGIRDIALKVVQDGICTPEDMDKAIMYGHK